VWGYASKTLENSWHARDIQNKWMRLREAIAELPNGQTTGYRVGEFGKCVDILPFVEDQNVIMVRQYRYVHQENHRWEMPTGGIRPGEAPEQAAQRDLMEEGEYRANQPIWISSYHTSKSVCHETAHLFIGRGLVAADDLWEQLQAANTPEAKFQLLEKFLLARLDGDRLPHPAIDYAVKESQDTG
jgi:8-oxo-dGTP pyrophosphatase MutT (NUDIX family)